VNNVVNNNQTSQKMTRNNSVCIQYDTLKYTCLWPHNFPVRLGRLPYSNEMNQLINGDWTRVTCLHPGLWRRACKVDNSSWRIHRLVNGRRLHSPWSKVSQFLLETPNTCSRASRRIQHITFDLLECSDRHISVCVNVFTVMSKHLVMNFIICVNVLF
jgi:hypothetical protein